MLLHGILMWTAWTIMGLVMIGTNRWYSYVTNKGFYIHVAFGVLILVISISMVLILSTVEPYFITAHTIFGTV